MAEFYTDHNVALSLVADLQTVGHTARAARDLGLAAVGDDEHLLRAAQEGWILVTHNQKHFHLLHNAWLRWTAAWQIAWRHSGILLVPHNVPSRDLAQHIHLLVPSGSSLAGQLHQWHSGYWLQR